MTVELFLVVNCIEIADGTELPLDSDLFALVYECFFIEVDIVSRWYLPNCGLVGVTSLIYLFLYIDLVVGLYFNATFYSVIFGESFWISLMYF